MITPTERWCFEAIGTKWEILTALPVIAEHRDHVTELIESFDQQWSRFRPDSVISELAKGKGSVPAPSDTEAMLSAYRELSAATRGAVNPLVGDLLARRGYDAAYTFRDGGTVAVPFDWEQIVTWDRTALRANKPVTIDVGALGKGRLVDLVSGALGKRYPELVVDASGDLRVQGTTQVVGLEDPRDPSQMIGTWEIAQGSICASATNRRVWAGLHHVMDARTGEPVTRTVATWAYCHLAMNADAIATALFFEGGPELAHKWGVQWVRVMSDRSVQWSPGSTAKVFA